MASKWSGFWKVDAEELDLGEVMQPWISGVIVALLTISIALCSKRQCGVMASLFSNPVIATKITTFFEKLFHFYESQLHHWFLGFFEDFFFNLFFIFVYVYEPA